MAAVVEIKINVDGSNATAGVQQVKKEFDGFSMVMTQTEQDAQRLSKSMDLTGTKTKEMGGHMATSLDSVRLLSQEFGLRMPRAIEAMLSRMPGVTSALGNIIPIMAGIAAIEIFARAIEGAVHLYKDLFDVNAAMEKYIDTASKAAESKFIDEASLETARTSLESLNAEIDRLDQKRVSAGVDKPGGGFFQYFNGLSVLDETGGSLDQSTAAGQGIQNHYSKNDGLERARAAAQQAQTDARAHELTREYAATELKDQAKINEEGLKGQALIQQKRRDAHAENEANNRADLARELDQQQALQKLRDLQIQMGVTDPEKLAQVPFVDQHAGEAKRDLADKAADADAAGQMIDLNRETNLAIMKADDQRVQAGLQGEALFARKMQDDIKETTRELENQGKAAEIPAKVREINEKYFDDLSERSVKAQNESGLSIRRSQSAGLTGAARIYADQDYQVNENNTKLSGDQRGAANEGAAREANQKLLDLQIQFVDSMDAVGERWVDSTLGGYARIDAEAAKSASDIKDKFDKAWGGSDIDQGSSQYLAAKQAEQNALTDVERGAAGKRSELKQANLAEDLRYDQDASAAEARVRENGMAGWIASYRNAFTSINDQEQQRLAKLTEDAAKEGLTYEEVAQRRTDIERQAGAEIEQQQQAMTQKLSGLFEQAFQDPIGTIKSMMEKLMFDLLAKWVLHFHAVQALFGSVTPGGSAQSGPAGVAGQIAGAMHAGGGATATAQPGASSSPGGGVFRPAYNGGAGPAGQVSSAGIVGGAASPGAIGGDVSSAQQLAQLTGVGSSSSDPYSGVSDDQGNVTLTGDIPGSSGSSALSTIGSYAGAGLAAYSAEQTTVAAFDKGSAGGVLSGTLGDAAAGATIGSVIPGIGTAIGAGVGAAVGFASGLAGAVMGMGGRIAARDYYEKTLFPAIEADRNGQSGDAMSAISDVHKQAVDGYGYMASHFGASGADWVKANYLDKEVALAISQITEHAQGGQQYTTRQAMQFDTGGYINDFGDFGTTGGHGFIHAELGETMINQPATAMHAPVLNAMNDGASPSDIARMYLASSRSSSSSAAAPSGGDQHIHVHAWDTDSVTKWLRTGGSRTIAKEQNNLATQYAGDGSIG